MSARNSDSLARLEVSCTDAESRSLLEDLKTSCRNGWFFETLRCTDQGQMVYKFILIDLAQQRQFENEYYIRYHGWLEAIETDQALVFRAAGELEDMLDSEVRNFLIKHFHDDVLEPVCRRRRLTARLSI